MNRILKAVVLTTVLALSAMAWGQTGTLVQQSSSDLTAATQAGHSHSTGATITLPAVGGQFQYITGMDIVNCAGASAVTAAAPTFITTTNLVGSPQYTVGSGVTAGLCQNESFAWTKPLKAAVVGTATTFVLPTFATNQTVGVNVYWYTAP